ncbi:MAG TPA: UDP-N-acetylglucosamine 2-epimerase (non-hydrolyzing) [Saprospiraceae bacterium]|nr:UDP-N-acetylglucosamine 2-epimerase (non-hydrolyzing) [Saprospiraceae bacterium]
MLSERKILTIIGARPQFIKAALVSKAFRDAKNIKEVVVHTGQHFEYSMSQSFFEELGLDEPKYFLGINSLSRDVMSRQMAERISEIIKKEQPKIVLLYGDTNSTYAGALAAKNFDLAIAHVEAGVRSFDEAMPEELNRMFVDSVSDYLFAPSERALEYLEENYLNGWKIFTGDIMKDAAMHFADQAICPKNLPEGRFVLATMHRASNTNDEEVLREIIAALNEIHIQTPLVLPLHPRTRIALNKFNIKCDFHCLPPVSYFEMLYLLKNTELVITDSGGLQKEAYYFKKPCVILRKNTEWPELVDTGAASLCEVLSKEDILEQYRKMKTNKIDFDKIHLYGDGDAAEIIVQNFDAYLDVVTEPY